MEKRDHWDQASFVTFYSFKGGVGRSMALINVAGMLAARGFRVLALDMDLEAPGISYLLRPDPDGQNHFPGFIDLLSDACARGMESHLFSMSPGDLIGHYSSPYIIPSEVDHNPDGCIRIMPAGLFDGQYQKRLDELDLGQLYRDGQGQPLIAAFKQIVLASGCFDLVLVDSRTGFSEESGICTRDLADFIVVVSGLNRQNQEGTAEFLKSLRRSGAVPSGLRVVFSPVPNGEHVLRQEREQEAAAALSQAWGQEIDTSLQIPYHPRLALTEEPFIFRRTRVYLYTAYSTIEQAILALVGLSAGAVRKKILEAVEAGEMPAVIAGLRQLAMLDNGIEMISLIAPELREISNKEEAAGLREFLSTKFSPSSPIIGALGIAASPSENTWHGAVWRRFQKDIELCESALSGNAADMQQIVDLLKSREFGSTLIARGASETEARDIVSDLISDCWSMQRKGITEPLLAHYNGTAPLAAFLRNVALNRLISFKRKSIQHRPSAQLEDAEELADPALALGEVGDSDVVRVLKEALIDGFAKADPESLVIFRLVHSYRVPQKIVGATWGRNESAISRSLRDLRVQLKNHILNYIREADPWLEIDWEDLVTVAADSDNERVFSFLGGSSFADSGHSWGQATLAMPAAITSLPGTGVERAPEIHSVTSLSRSREELTGEQLAMLEKMAAREATLPERALVVSLLARNDFAMEYFARLLLGRPS